MLSHENAVSFVDWCSEVFQPHKDNHFLPMHRSISTFLSWISMYRSNMGRRLS